MDNYYLGGDASKGYTDFVILDANKKEIEPNFQLDDIYEGHCKLYEIIELLFHNQPDCTLYAAVESTGGYENNWFQFLMDISACFNIKVARLNPYGVNKNSQAALKRNITDKISAQNIAEYLITHPENVSYQSSDPLAPLKEQWNYIELLKKQKVQSLNFLEKNIYKANPELLIYWKEGAPRWLLKVIKQFPTARLLAQATPEELEKIPYVTYRKAETIIKRAHTSVASATDSNTADRIKELVDDILQKDNKIEQQKYLLAKNTKIASEKIQLLTSFKGIGTYSAVGLLILIGDVHKFATAKKLACFFGVHPVYKKSGDGTWAYRMSKKGSNVARQILFMIAFSAIRHNPLIKEIYEINLNKGMERLAAIGVCMHKILRIVYGMLKHNSPFDPEIDRQNRKKQHSNPQKVSRDRSRRHQAYDQNAPISRRQTKKKKHQERSLNQEVVVIDSKVWLADLSSISLN